MMTERTRPPFHAEHVGSFVRPERLRAARAEWAAGRLPHEALAALEDEYIREIVHMQNRLGMPSTSDGEFRREQWMLAFREAVEGYSRDTIPGTFKFTQDDGTVTDTRPVPLIKTRLKRAKPLVAQEFAFFKDMAKGVPKATIPSPSMAHHQAGDAALDRALYPDRHAFMADVVAIYRDELADLARLGCTYLQIDECAIPVLCDQKNRERVAARGESADANVDFYVDALNAILRGRPAGMTVAMHMCRGNTGQGMASGGYEPIAERVFARLDVDGYLLEYDTPRAGDFEPLRFLPKDKMAVLGLVSTKVHALEPVDALRARFEEAARFVDLAQLGLCPQCGFASTYTTARFSRAEEERKLTRVLEAAASIWG
jgi:5-methyltetrahydropteroyltriglutamate--homocysteine methyltransferase